MSRKGEELSSLATPTALQAFLEAAPDAIVVIDARGCMVIVNRLAMQLFGYTRDELLHQPVEMLVPAAARGRHAAHREGYFAEPRTRSMGEGFELAGHRKDGSEFPVEISLSPLRTPTGVLVISIIRDISERKDVETRLRASLQEKEVLLREVHHRVKNNLQIVSSMLNLQMAQISDAHSLELFKESQARVHSIALFHEKLYESRDLAQISMSDYLGGLAVGLFATYGVNRADIALKTALEDVPVGVDAAIACGLIVNELVSNALKYAFPDGRHGQVAVSLRREGPEAVLEVVDDGVGFPAGADLRRPGSLGLRLVSILAEQTGGRLDLESNGGTRCTLRFPVEEVG
jgi:two-component system, sensor histidine kinase PdtaS